MRPAAGAFLAVLVSTAACYAYRTAPAAPAAGSRVRVVLVTAWPVATLAPGRDAPPLTHAGVLEVAGRMEAASADTVAVRLGELRTAAGVVPDVAGRIALLPTAAIARIEVRKFQAGATALAGLGVSALAMGAFLALVIAAMTIGF